MNHSIFKKKKTTQQHIFISSDASPKNKFIHFFNMSHSKDKHSNSLSESRFQSLLFYILDEVYNNKQTNCLQDDVDMGFKDEFLQSFPSNENNHTFSLSPILTLHTPNGFEKEEPEMLEYINLENTKMKPEQRL